MMLPKLQETGTRGQKKTGQGRQQMTCRRSAESERKEIGRQSWELQQHLRETEIGGGHCQGLYMKKMSARLGQVHFPLGQVTFSAHLPVNTTQARAQENHPVTKLLIMILRQIVTFSIIKLKFKGSLKQIYIH